jgi:hypothetical protein
MKDLPLEWGRAERAPRTFGLGNSYCSAVECRHIPRVLIRFGPSYSVYVLVCSQCARALCPMASLLKC